MPLGTFLGALEAHLKSTVQTDDFYKNASNIKEWEVIELHIGGLPHDCDDVRPPCGSRINSIYTVAQLFCRLDIEGVRLNHG